MSIVSVACLRARFRPGKKVRQPMQEEVLIRKVEVTIEELDSRGIGLTEVARQATTISGINSRKKDYLKKTRT